MPAAPLPPDERERLRALAELHVLDSEAEEAFDRVARLAARVFGVPTALVSFVDRERQWFKACYGFDVRQTDRRVSFCAHAILGDAVFEVPDATADPRFADNPLVTGDHHVRYYAGAPLRLASGHAVGTVCLLDVVPRAPLDADARATLADLAAVVVDALQLRTERRALVAAKHEIERLAAHDPLTGALNRRGLMERFEGALALARRTGAPLAVLVLDLDGFKEVNDRLGHDAGDALLVAVAHRLRGVVRDHDLVARLGGDEFVAVLQAADAAAARVVAERLVVELARPVALGDHRVAVRASVGVAAFPEAGEDALELLRAGDAAMYAAKRAGVGVEAIDAGTMKPSADAPRA